SGCILIGYFRYEKQRIERERIRDQSKAVGKPRLGGPFKLIDQNGNEYTEKELEGRFKLVYFGFTHCPDICPEELDKMAEMIDCEFALPGLWMMGMGEDGRSRADWVGSGGEGVWGCHDAAVHHLRPSQR